MSEQLAAPQSRSAHSADGGAVDQTIAATTPPAAGSRILRWILKTMTGLVVLAGLFVLTGYLLPSVYAVEETVEIEALPVDFHSEVGILTRWPQWTVWSKDHDPERFSDLKFKYGKHGGTGAAMSWTDSKNGGGNLKITRCDFTNGIEYEMTLDKGDSPMKGAIRYHRTDTGTKVTWKCSGSIGNNPINRWMHVLFINDSIKDDYRAGLEKLKTFAEREAARRRQLTRKFQSSSLPKTGRLAQYGSDSATADEFAEKLLMNDADQDGNLSRSESPATLKWLFGAGDKNQNGLLEPDELKRLWRDLKASREEMQKNQPPARKRRRPPLEDDQVRLGDD